MVERKDIMCLGYGVVCLKLCSCRNDCKLVLYRPGVAGSDLSGVVFSTHERDPSWTWRIFCKRGFPDKLSYVISVNHRYI